MISCGRKTELVPKSIRPPEPWCQRTVVILAGNRCQMPAKRSVVGLQRRIFRDFWKGLLKESVIGW